MNNINLHGTDWCGVVSSYFSPISELYIAILHISGVSLAASYASNVIFANLFSEQVLSTATGNMITEKQVLTVKSPAIDSKLNGLRLYFNSHLDFIW